jgi:hypothetical protein
VAWSASFVLGPGFAVGTGTGVSILTTKLGALPVFPMLHGLPRDGSRLVPYGLAFLALPVLAGVTLALVVLRGRHREPGARMRAAGTATVAVALAAGLVATMSGGPLAGGRMATLGPSGWRTAAATLLLLGVSAAGVVLAPPSAQALRRLPLRRRTEAEAAVAEQVVADAPQDIAAVVDPAEPAEPDQAPDQADDQPADESAGQADEPLADGAPD